MGATRIPAQNSSRAYSISYSELACRSARVRTEARALLHAMPSSRVPVPGRIPGQECPRPELQCPGKYALRVVGQGRRTPPMERANSTGDAHEVRPCGTAGFGDPALQSMRTRNQGALLQPASVRPESMTLNRCHRCRSPGPGPPAPATVAAVGRSLLRPESGRAPGGQRSTPISFSQSAQKAGQRELGPCASRMPKP